ncbi:hypothetical protein H0H87_009566 [Tephrocybe sp. NHM501043]|nr:hypothetical protein H0H87_009566 [Tephrocybe sp. NHM501043]
MLIGGNYTLPIKDHLASQSREEKSIFDLGCGTGAWYDGLSLQHSWLYIDEYDLGQQTWPQSSLNAGLLVLISLLWTSGITDYPSLIEEFSRVTKPGGFLQLQEWDFFVVNDNKKRLDGTESWFGRWCEALRHGLSIRGAGVNAAEGLDGMITEKGFESVQQQDVWMPIGPCFPKDTTDGMRLNLVGEFMRENVKAFIKGGRTIVGSGMDPDEYNQLAYEATKEVQVVSLPMYLRLHCVTARKQ